ncbi:NUDIX hydrolase [Ruegeria atlantica]|uniref:NUDIX hydrolase n=1 Tax=Ruegeria atlantica TaxID=81569 RepID=UPI001480F127|nr:NUDIX hydrolase [Ruegeria atlantica]
MGVTPKLAAIAVLIRNKKVLLVKRRNAPDIGLWGFPGGHVNLGETAMDAAARELREETGVVAKPLKYLTNVDVIVRNEKKNLRYHFLLAAVWCQYLSGEPIAQDDVSEAEWHPISSVMSGNLRCSEQVDTVVQIAEKHERSLSY